MTLTFPLPLANLHDRRRDLDLLYGPGWSIAVNGDGVVEIVPTNWAEMTPAERERGRERIMELWDQELRIPADGGK